MIDWNAVSALGTVLTAVVVLLTAIFGFRQLQLTRTQLEQLRRATQLDGAMRIFDNLNSQWYGEARRFVATDLPRHLQDPTFRKEVELGIIWTRNQSAVHHEALVLRTFETIGTQVQRGLLDLDVIVDTAAIPIIVTWEHLAEVIAIQRRTIHPRMWENFEHLYLNAKRWFIERADQDRYDAWRDRVMSDHAE